MYYFQADDEEERDFATPPTAKSSVGLSKLQRLSNFDESVKKQDDIRTAPQMKPLMSLKRVGNFDGEPERENLYFADLDEEDISFDDLENSSGSSKRRRV